MSKTLQDTIFSTVLNVPDFPKPGVSFKDITPLFMSPQLCSDIIDQTCQQFLSQNIHAVIGLESRGFLLGLPIAIKLGVPFVLVRKKGKLPRATHSITYQLEYGNSTLEIHKDSLPKNARVLIHDDVLATGGTAAATAELVHLCDAEVVGFTFILELVYLHGRMALDKFNVPVSTFASYLK